jgi:hypothetical protein
MLLILLSGEHFEEADVQNFQWAEAITGLTIVLLICLEFSLERFIDNRLHAKARKSKEADVNTKNDEDDFNENGSHAFKENVTTEHVDEVQDKARPKLGSRRVSGI